MGIDAEMFVRTRQNYTPEQIRRMAGDLAEAFGPSHFWINKDSNTPEWRHHALAIVALWEQDGPDVQPEAGEQFIRVHLGTRYYGKGYECGDLPTIMLVAMWLEARIPDAKVWYGGDSSGVCAELFDHAARQELWKHFVEVGHTPYSNAFGMFSPRGASDPWCEFCDRKLTNCGGGGADTFYYCSGCGEHWIHMGQTNELIELPRGEDLFAGHQRLLGKTEAKV